MTNQPEIIITETDADRLETLLNSLPEIAFPGKRELEYELERAQIVASKDIPPTVVTMNSEIKFRVLPSNEEFCLTLVYPKDVKDNGKTISILAPVGSALLGLSQGDQISWPKPGGGMLTVEIEEILYQPERSGEYHR